MNMYAVIPCFDMRMELRFGRRIGGERHILSFAQGIARIIEE